MKVFGRIGTTLAVTSFMLGVILGFLGQYNQLLTILQPFHFVSEISTQQLVTWVSLGVTYPAALLVFYFLGRRPVSSIRVGWSVFATFCSALLGEMTGQTAILLVPQGSVGFVFPFSFIASVPSSFTFLIVAFSGFALSRLLHGDLNPPVNRWKGNLVVVLVALAFYLEASFLYETLDLQFQLTHVFSISSSFFALYGLNIVIALPLQLAVFYYVGRRIAINGRTFKILGLLFIGAYAGTVIGTLAAVGLFGHTLWTLPVGQGSTVAADGIVYHNVPTSLLLILESLNPIKSLPFLAFFAMSISRLGGRDGLRSSMPSHSQSDTTLVPSKTEPNTI